MAKYDNVVSVENTIDAIKQKHFRDLDREDYAFLAANEAFLSPIDRKIYLEGVDPFEAVQDGTPITRNERIINENRPLQDAQRKIADAKIEASNAERNALAPKFGDERTEEEKELAKERKTKILSLKKENEVFEKEEKARIAREDKENKAAAKKAEKEAKDAEKKDK